MKIKKGDKVQIIAGKDKGKSGKVIQVITKSNKVVVEGVNQVKKNVKASPQNPNSGIITKEAPISSSKVMLVCPACKKATRIKKTAVAGAFVRTCKKCGEVIDK